MFELSRLLRDKCEIGATTEKDLIFVDTGHTSLSKETQSMILDVELTPSIVKMNERKTA